ncbi:zinc ribbon domain-containing protein [Pseudomonas sp. PS01300]|uniref:zinc ribbon domain-containing protein n=1 Tax=Pseudomonas sp. PS01300 TaxID=2991436 RepID=UPI00249AA8CA|nr:zinc ribbon domain-containing protein [Pseudomonas sp. PS01300]
MHRFIYLLALAAAVIGFLDVIDAPDGSRAQMEAGFLFLSVPVLLLAGFVVGRVSLKKCPSCKERVKKDANICKHCRSPLGEM